MNGHPHPHDERGPASPETPMDAGSQALAEALRSSFAVVKVLMVILVVAFICSGIFMVGPQERALLLRFGKPVGEGEKALLGPGLHWAWPYPIDEHVKVSITGIQQVRSSVAWYATTDVAEAAGTETPVAPGMPLNPAVDGYALTADGNIIHARATLTYHIEDPVRYIFGFANGSNVVQNALNNALLDTAARFNVDQVLSSDRAAFREAVRRRVTELLDSYKVGVAVEDCTVPSIPPRQLKMAFDNVVKAGIVRQQVLAMAHSAESQILGKAIAEAASRTNSAEVERVQLVKNTASQAKWFSDLLPRYQANPNLFVQLRLAETFGRALGGAWDKWIQPAPGPGKNVVNWILLNREPPKLKPENPTQP